MNHRFDALAAPVLALCLALALPVRAAAAPDEASQVSSIVIGALHVDEPDSSMVIGALHVDEGFLPAGEAEGDANQDHETNAPPASDAADNEGFSPESIRTGVREAVTWAVKGVDSWFGDIPFEEGGRISRGRIRFWTVWREGDHLDPHLRFRVSARLPNLSDRIRLLVGSENDRDYVRDRPDEVLEQQRMTRKFRREDETMFVGLGVRLFDGLGLRLTVRDLYKPCVKLRYEKNWDLGGGNSVHFQETAFWALKDGFGETTVLAFQHDITDNVHLRWAGSGTLSEEDHGLDWYSSVGLVFDFPDQRQFSAEILADGETGDDVDVREYGLLLTWRQPLYSDWLLGEIRTGYYWEKEHKDRAREGEAAVSLGVRMHF